MRSVTEYGILLPLGVRQWIHADFEPHIRPVSDSRPDMATAAVLIILRMTPLARNGIPYAWNDTCFACLYRYGKASHFGIRG
jgi:hypothetical protein